MVELMDGYEEYLEQSAKQVLNRLKDVHQHNCMLSVSFGLANQGYISYIVAVDEASKSLEFDCADDEALNEALLRAETINFHTKFQGISVWFSGNEVRKSVHGQHGVFQMALPGYVVWMQRRQCYRVSLSEVSGIYCSLMLTSIDFVDLNQLASAISAQNSFRLRDLSFTGFSFLAACPGLNDSIVPGKSYVGLLKLGDGSNIEAKVDFVVVRVEQIKTHSGETKLLIGCKFNKMPLVFETELLRFIRAHELQQLKLASAPCHRSAPKT